MDDAARARLVSWARDCADGEACGLVLGARRDGLVEVRRFVLCRNFAADRRRSFEIHPEDHLAAQLAAERAGLAVVGVWHSHPNGPATPSAIDRAAAWDGWIHAIVGRDARGEFEVRVWHVRGEAWMELTHSTAANERGAHESSDRLDQ